MKRVWNNYFIEMTGSCIKLSCIPGMAFINPIIIKLATFKILKPCMLNKLIQSLERENLSPGRQDHLFHILAPTPETPPAYTGNYLIFRIVRGTACKAQFSQVLNACYLIPCRAGGVNPSIDRITTMEIGPDIAVCRTFSGSSSEKPLNV